MMDVDREVSASPKIDESPALSEKCPKDTLLEVLDKVETHVEQFRKDTLLLEEKRDNLFTTLDTVRNSDLLSELDDSEKDDVQRYIERLASRCSTVEISVRTDRDSSQEEALSHVNRLIDSLVVDFKKDPVISRSKCESYMASCSPQPQFPVDKTFENALLGCALDDQKRIKKRLLGLMKYLDNFGKIILED